MRRSDTGRRQRQNLDDLFKDIPELKAVVIDTFEQRVQRHQERDQADTYYSGKKKAHTLKNFRWGGPCILIPYCECYLV